MHSRIFVFAASIAALLLISNLTYADELNREIAKCAVITGDLDKLECFNKLSKSLGLDGPQSQDVQVTGNGNWEINHSKNPIDDSERVVISLMANSGNSRWGQPIWFVARCESNETDAYIIWNDYLGDDSSSVYSDWKYVTIRIGKNKSEKQKWGISTDKKATFAPNWAGDLLKKMANETTFVAQTTPFSENPVTAIFDTTGMTAALKPLAETCSWKLD